MKITCSMWAAKRMIPAGHTVHSSRAFISEAQKLENNFLKINVKRHSTSAWNDVEQRERAIGMLTAGMSARDVAQHFQRHESTISRLLNRFQQTGKVADRPRSGKPRKNHAAGRPFSHDFLSTQ